jgi:PAS domain S-box-containing protein
MKGMNIDTAAKVTTISATSIGGIYYAWQKILKPFVSKKKKERKEILSKIQDIHNELKFNGGGSIKDAIWRLENKTDKILIEIDDIKETHKIAMNVEGIPYWISDEEGRYIYASPNLCNIMGHSESEILGNNWTSVIIAEDRERIFSCWNFSVKNRTPFDEIYTFEKTDGSLVKVNGIAFHKTVNGKHTGTLGRLEVIK